MSEPLESDRLGDAPHPRETDRLVGHEQAERALLEAYRGRRLHHAWLLGGPKGIGKATLAWRFARFLLANPDPDAPAVRDATSLAVPADHPVAGRIRRGAVGDIAVLRRQWNDKSKKLYGEIRVDEVRAALGLFQQAAGAGGFRLCILDSADDLNRNSANALLKAIEEPPRDAVFLIVSHQPSRVMPTILSRCRKLPLGALAAEEVAAALGTLPGVDAASTPEERATAARRSGGSIGRALGLLDETRRALDRDLLAALDALPATDGRVLYRLADRLAGTDAAEAVGMLLETMLEWIDARLQAGAAAGAAARSLAPLAEVWEKLHASARDADALNLDRRPLILSMFADLATAVRMAGRT